MAVPGKQAWYYDVDIDKISTKNCRIYTFRSPAISAQIFPINTNYTSENKRLLKFLGDSLLRGLTAALMHRRLPDARCTELVMLSCALTSNYFYGKICKKIGLHNMLPKEMLSRQPENSKFFADLFEAYYFAIYKDCNYDLEAVQAMFDRLITPFLEVYYEWIKPEHQTPNQQTHQLQISAHALINSKRSVIKRGESIIRMGERPIHDVNENFHKRGLPAPKYTAILRQRAGKDYWRISISTKCLTILSIWAPTKSRARGDLTTKVLQHLKSKKSYKST
ncbi:Dicer-like protein 1 [Orbilia oligospora]|uniref:Dicer-like protein 1 n=1 Tax=Orbilia oligospora TaxID=2813651 RepID=A0A7C8Q4E5_ORBOL|nr:Dicer-like protein 1 [Orbilia oligospora]